MSSGLLRRKGTKSLIAVGVLSFLVVLLIGAPASLMAPAIKNAPGVSAQLVEGSLWNPRIKSLSVDGVYVGDLEAKFLPLRLATGKAAFAFSLSGGAFDGDAVLSQSLFGATRISSADFTVSRDFLRRYALLGVTVDGSASIRNGNIEMKSIECIAASGDIETDALSVIARQFGLPDVNLVGGVVCRDDMLAITLENLDNPMGAVVFDLAQMSDFRYRMNVRIETGDPNIKNMLQLGGFEIDGDVASYEEVASWTEPPPGPALRGGMSALRDR